MISDLRVGLFVVYSGLLLWRSRGTPDGTPPDWWKMILIFAALNFLLDLAARIAYWWAGRRAIQKYRAMDPRLSRDIIFRNQSSTLMRRLGEAVEREGDAEVGGAVERFPFARGARIATTSAFVGAVALGLILLVTLAVPLARVPAVLGWVMWSVACLCAVGAAWARRRLRHLETILEMTAFTIAEVGPHARRVLHWNETLVLVSRPRWRRLELRRPGAREFIALDYDRVGIHRAVYRVLLHFGLIDESGKLRRPEE